MNVKEKIKKLETLFKRFFGVVPSSMAQLQELFVKKSIPDWDQGYWIEKFIQLQECYVLLEHIEERGLGDLL